MNAASLLEKQLSGVNSMLHYVLDNMTDFEWTERAVAGQNLIGFISWHVVRTQDFTIQTMIRGLPELIAEERWADKGSLLAPVYSGITLEEADRIAQSVRRADVLEYADAVSGITSAWLSGVIDAELDVVPQVEAHLAPYPAYRHSGFQEEIVGQDKMPVWRLITGPCIGHVRGHIGEMQAMKAVLRLDA